MSALHLFPLEAAGYADKPRDTVIVGWPGWDLTVGDVLDARAAKPVATDGDNMLKRYGKHIQAIVAAGNGADYPKAMGGLFDEIAKHVGGAAASAKPVAPADEREPNEMENLIHAAEFMMKWCVKNVQKWSFAEYDELDHAVTKARAALVSQPGAEVPSIDTPEFQALANSMGLTNSERAEIVAHIDARLRKLAAKAESLRKLVLELQGDLEREVVLGGQRYLVRFAQGNVTHSVWLGKVER